MSFEKNPERVPTKAERIAFANTLLFETPGGLRFTQDSPILPNVWLAYAAEPHKQQELILTTTQNGGTGQAAQELRTMLNHLRQRRDKNNIRERPRVSYIPGQIAARLYFDELMRVVLPLTPWWHETYDSLRKLEHTIGNKKPEARIANWKTFPQPDSSMENDLVDAMMIMRQDIFPSTSPDENIDAEIEKAEEKAEILQNDYDTGEKMPSGASKNLARLSYVRAMPPELAWMVRIAGLIGDCFSDGSRHLLEGDNTLSGGLQREFIWRKRLIEDPDLITTHREQMKMFAGGEMPTNEEAIKTRIGIVSAFTGLYKDWSTNDKYPKDRLIWRITKNRPIKLAVNKSSLTVKADAATRLFDISCKDITWAVLDSGIDNKHEAFKLLSPENEKKTRNDLKQKKDRNGDHRLWLDDIKESRITKTLDFTRLRELLDYEIDDHLNNSETIRKNVKIKKEIARRTKINSDVSRMQSLRMTIESAAKLLEDMRDRINQGKDINWLDLQGAIVDNNPEKPSNDHGTHVAGILGADWIEENENELALPFSQRSRRMKGMCPDINIIDVRVFREDGLTDEFELLAAIQYLRWMNSRAGTMAVHGANLSLSLIHEVRRFACGQTPICEECNESSALGMVIVAAAGNHGFDMNNVEEVASSDSYKSVSITDPGNAARVITVGATHRKRPYEYGVSYFSSRGPTGDGRLKPDLVAPGEKIRGPTPNDRAEFKDGTSMAAPHVSGAAALLIARHTELIGQPERIKKILCETATDLGRERYFQGHGLVDVLRALQSV